MNFKSTTHNECVCHTIFEVHTALLLHQEDDFLISCKHKSTAAKKIFNCICKKLTVHDKSEPPFKHLGPAKDWCNGVNLTQTQQCVEISCSGCTNHVARAHGWDTPSQCKTTLQPTAPLPEKEVGVFHKDRGPLEGSKECQQPQKQMGFACRTPLCEPLHACVTCQPDIGFAVTTMAKSSAQPTETHCKCLK